MFELEFMRPERLWWLLLIPALIGLYLVLLRRRRSKARPHAITNLERVLPKQQAWKRHAAVGAAVLSLAALNVAFAQPKGEVEVPRERATVVLTLDVSRSMLAEDMIETMHEYAGVGIAALIDGTVDVAPVGLGARVPPPL